MATAGAASDAGTSGSTDSSGGTDSSGRTDSLGQRLRRWRPTRRGVAVAALLLVALLVLALTATPRTGYLDPAAVDPLGSRAAATILAEQGVQVRDVRLTEEVAEAAEGATVLLTSSVLVSPGMLESVLAAEPARIVLVDPVPGSPAFDQLAPGVDPAAAAEDESVEPGCALPVAHRAGDAVLPGSRYDARGWATDGAACYDGGARSALVVIPPRGQRPEVVLLGSGHPLTNDGLDEAGNAALSLGVLGSRPVLVWWRPTPTDPALAGQAPAAPLDLMPTWVVPVLLQVLVAALLVVWWRARRLGRLVVEPLPVVVRAGETTSGHARLLHAHHARDEAARHLRARARESIRVRLGLPLGVTSTRLAEVAALRCARPPREVAALLYGPEPTTDAQLVALGHDLDALIAEVGGA
jgi:hypothetical protein